MENQQNHSSLEQAAFGNQTPFSILRPVVAPPRLDNLSILARIDDPQAELSFIFSERLSELDPMAFDIETAGNDPASLSSHVVGVGLADSRGSVYIDLRRSHPDTWLWLLRKLDEHQIPLVAHNLFFDAAYVMRDMRAAGHSTGWLRWQHCTYALYKLLASCGWPGQTWGLKQAQVQLLGWQESNDKLLKRWLVENGHTTRPVSKATRGKLQPHLKAPEPEPAGREEHDVPSREVPEPDVQHVEGDETTVLEFEGPLVLTIRRKGD